MTQHDHQFIEDTIARLERFVEISEANTARTRSLIADLKQRAQQPGRAAAKSSAQRLNTVP